MGKYLYLQLKRIAGSFAVILAVTVVLVLGVSVIISEFSEIALNGEENRRFQIAICGDTEGDYIDLGLKALETIDDARFALDVLVLDEAQAARALARGEISAYVVLPENFIENAINGVMAPVTFVTAAGQSGVVTMFKNEITGLITDLVVYSQKGTYATYDALKENGASDIAYEYMNVISIQYAELVFGRGDVYTYKSVGVSEGLGMTEYYVCSLSVLLLMLMGIPFAFVHIRRERSLDRILLSRGYSERTVLVCEYVLHALCLILMCAVSVILMIAVFFVRGSNALFDPSKLFSFEFVLRMIPVILMQSALDLLIFETQDNVVGGVLTHFFLALCICYSSGCMYPVYALPDVMQRISVFLPAGLARSFTGGVFTYEPQWLEFGGIAIYALIFLAFAYLIRVYKTRKCER